MWRNRWKKKAVDIKTQSRRKMSTKKMQQTERIKKRRVANKSAIEVFSEIAHKNMD